MEVNVKLFATLRDGRFKEEKTNINENTQVSDVISKYNIPKEEVKICLVNGRDADLNQTLKNGDTLSLFPPVGGG
ncbi:MoaD/ThiS family protein [Sedimentibacter saalensis]|jgi:sulfur carrier protein|uniref:MoaD/ThiS family protein n=1 Tax=Sedimentibacter saalensis TaxID=130788 RepID=UPI0028A1512F|nr:MoaD/ThiS family protein [Sedimentibacter saalensis]